MDFSTEISSSTSYPSHPSHPEYIIGSQWIKRINRTQWIIYGVSENVSMLEVYNIGNSDLIRSYSFEDFNLQYYRVESF